MKKEEFAVAFSEKPQEEAVREVSLNIKLVFPKHIKYLIILSTPGYHPSAILKAVNLTLKPQRILGIQAPLLIFEGKVVQRGIIACCINNDKLELKETFLKIAELKKVESFLASTFKGLKGRGFSFLSFVSYGINPSSYLNAMRLSLGKIFNLQGAGFMRKYSSYSSQIINNETNEGLVNIAMRGLDIHSMKLEGYTPLGEPFTITKVVPSKDIVIEINGKPAINIYKHYLEEKFEIFMKNRLFSFYPLGIMVNGSMQLLNIVDCLEDGSLVCMGKVKEKVQGHVMFLDLTLLLKNLKSKLKTIEIKKKGVVFIINSLTRKKILKDTFNEEIKIIKETLGNELKMIGLYCDYSLSSNEENGDINIETGNLLLTVWQ